MGDEIGSTDTATTGTNATALSIVERGASFVREHTIWALSFAALLFASARILVASGGNAETLKSLVQNLDVTALVLATLLPFATTILLWLVIFLAVNSILGKEATPPARKTEIVLAAVITFVVIWFTMSLGYLITNIIAFLAIVIMGLIGSWADKRVKLRRISGTLGAVIAAAVIVLLIIVPFRIPGIWLPKEIITMTGQPLAATGYVLSSDEHWITYMDVDHRVQLVKAELVTNRQSIDESKIWYHRTMNELLPVHLPAWASVSM
jgi:hypothetical protein